MKKDIADKWVAALRSGKYKQTRHKLKDRAGNMCCLGVLCDISELGVWNEPFFGEAGYSIDGFLVTGVLPVPVKHWANMSSKTGVLIQDPESDCLSSLNDSGKTFAEIADIIEQNYETL